VAVAVVAVLVDAHASYLQRCEERRAAWCRQGPRS